MFQNASLKVDVCAAAGADARRRETSKRADGTDNGVRARGMRAETITSLRFAKPHQCAHAPGVGSEASLIW
jgi:hypothetical protein